jgi:putative ABC transport system ATP-binding protein
MDFPVLEQPESTADEDAPSPMTEARNCIVRMEGVSRLYRSAARTTQALSSVTFSIARGEFVALTGPSGCGKSTLLSIMGLLDEPDSGSFFLNGTDVSALRYAKRARLRNEEIGFIFQAFNLIPQMTVFQNIELPLSYRKALTVKGRRERIRAALAQVDLLGRDNDYPSQLSGGQQQRVAIARALVGSPTLLLADEPTGNLDSQSGEAILRLFEKLHKDGATVCIATHDQQHALIAERRIPLLDGKLLHSEQ